MQKPGVEVACRGKVLGTSFLEGGELTIGRQKDNRVVLEDVTVSRHHARIVQQGDEFVLEDLDSSSGTLVRGSKVRSHRLCHGDEIVIAGYTLRFQLPDSGEGREGSEAPPNAQSDTLFVRRTHGPLEKRTHGKEGDPPGEEPRREGPTGGPVEGPEKRGETEAAAPLEIRVSSEDENDAALPDETSPGLEVPEEFGPGLRVFQGRNFLFEMVVPDEGLTMGRAPGCGLVLRGEDVSRHHARIVQYDAGRYEIEDAGSRNGTHVNGVLTGKRSLDEGDEIRIGGFRLIFCLLPRKMETGNRTATAYIARDSQGIDIDRAVEEAAGGTLASAQESLKLRGGRIEVSCGGHTYAFILRVEDATVAETVEDADEAVRVRLVIEDRVLEGRLPLSSLDEPPRERRQK